MIRRKLDNNRGEVALHMAVILLVAVLLLAALLEVFHVYSVVRQLSVKLDAAVLSVAADNVGEVYGGIRESAGSARHYAGGTWATAVTTADVAAALRLSMGLTETGGGLAKSTADGVSFRLLGLHTQYTGSAGAKAQFTTTLTTEIPLYLGGTALPPLRLQQEVHTTYDAKF